MHAGLSGRVGASAGHLLNVPWAFALPGGGVNVALKYSFYDAFYSRSDVSVNLGVGETGTIGGSYRAQTGLGVRWFDVGWASLDTRSYIGLTSFSLIPVPGIGARLDVSVKPMRFEYFVWELLFATGLDLLVIVPNPWIGAGTGVYVPIGGWKIGLEVNGNAEAVVAVVANVVSANATARLYTTVEF
jgi:hypothetical protein